jgi:hypothetical protein
MAQEHEYALLGGLNRSNVGRYIGIVAASVSSAIVFLILTVVNIAKAFGWSPNVPPMLLSLVGAGAVYTVLYWLFERHVWKLPWLSKALHVPNLSGEWRCEGQTINPDKSMGYVWGGNVTIVQSWDKLRVRLRTPQSGSNSIAAALIYDAADGFRLLYNYVNEPKIGEPELSGHRGFAEFVFAPDLQTADGEYFNGHGRYTFGTMHLVREAA